jgi:heme oxygenase
MMLRLFKADYTMPEYQAHLSRLLGLFEPLERAAEYAAVEENPVRTFQRSSDLREDLLVMGAAARDIDGLERCARIPPITTSGLRGYTYVVLGSMLGGRIIVKQLREVLGQEASVRFYGGGNGQFETAWAWFREDLENNGKNDVDAICSTAAAIFDAYSDWLSGMPLHNRCV